MERSEIHEFLVQTNLGMKYWCTQLAYTVMARIKWTGGAAILLTGVIGQLVSLPVEELCHHGEIDSYLPSE